MPDLGTVDGIRAAREALFEKLLPLTSYISGGVEYGQNEVIRALVDLLTHADISLNTQQQMEEYQRGNAR